MAGEWKLLPNTPDDEQSSWFLLLGLSRWCSPVLAASTCNNKATQ